nr:aminotransferase class I/II-fold pyridoxal phosphate-dependent enzyme [Nocardioides panaciterrulae]
MRTGKLFRYAEEGAEPSEAARWEEEVADYLGRRYVIAVNSCGAALYLALHSLGLQPGDPVLLNAWTLAPVPGAVEHAGGRAVLVETTRDLTIDLEDLERQARAHRGGILLLSHMRGHISDLAAVQALCAEHDLRLVEDCAHSIGGSWDGQLTGTFGDVGCFSTQTYKHLNSGEGGLLATDDDEIAARAILASGSYMLYGQHTRRPDLARFEDLRGLEPNHSMRLTSTAAAVLRPQLRSLPARVAQWNERYDRIAGGLAGVPGIRLPERPPAEQFVGSSLQFFLDDLTGAQITTFCRVADGLGVHVKWFGAERPEAFTSAYTSWAYAERRALPGTDAVLSTLCDIRIPLALPPERCEDVVAILAHALDHARAATTHSPNQPGR